MELVTPSFGTAAAGYTFEPEGVRPVELPPVWRCRCGFQLDAWLPSPAFRQHARSIRGNSAARSLPLPS